MVKNALAPETRSKKVGYIVNSYTPLKNKDMHLKLEKALCLFAIIARELNIDENSLQELVR